MCILPDFLIKDLVEKEEIIIDPYFSIFQGPSCYYCHLGKTFYIPKRKKSFLDPLDSSTLKELFKVVHAKDFIIMNPGDFLLAETFEFFGVSKYYAIKLLNSSSLARCGISHAALGMINPGCGFKDPIRLTLELVNNFPRPIKLTPTIVPPNGKIRWGTEVLKISIIKMEAPPKTPYNEWEYGVYKYDKSVTGPKMVNRFKKSKKLYLPNNSLVWERK